MRNSSKPGNERPKRSPAQKQNRGEEKRQRYKSNTNDAGEGKESKPFRKTAERPGRSESNAKPPFRQGAENNSRGRTSRSEKPRYSEKPNRRTEEDTTGRKPYRRKDRDENEEKTFGRERTQKTFNKGFREKSSRWTDKPASGNRRKPSEDGLTRLNKYIANAGICSRREADELIQAGVIKVNGKIVTELGFKVGPGDKVLYEDQLIRSEKLVYVLLNKPKGYITTTDDPYDRKTVMALVENACRERIYPVGRLDRNTSGLLLLTNDGELAKKLTHPKHEVRKVYHVELDKSLTKADMQKIAEGVELEDGPAHVDEIAYAEGSSNKRELGVELHSGRNRIVRRIFESLGYEVVKLDRVIFAGLTKKDLPRGHWRMITEKELNFLKMIR
jgi:23S rRNA pseudouridine2605 synthase